MRTFPQNSDFNTDLRLYETGRAKIYTWPYRIENGLSIDQGGVYSEVEKLLELLNDSHKVFAEFFLIFSNIRFDMGSNISEKYGLEFSSQPSMLQGSREVIAFF
jgi:hypothetical protein